MTKYDRGNQYRRRRKWLMITIAIGPLRVLVGQAPHSWRAKPLRESAATVSPMFVGNGTELEYPTHDDEEKKRKMVNKKKSAKRCDLCNLNPDVKRYAWKTRVNHAERSSIGRQEDDDAKNLNVNQMTRRKRDTWRYTDDEDDFDDEELNYWETEQWFDNKRKPWNATQFWGDCGSHWPMLIQGVRLMVNFSWLSSSNKNNCNSPGGGWVAGSRVHDETSRVVLRTTVIQTITPTHYYYITIDTVTLWSLLELDSDEILVRLWEIYILL